jgi:CubicO group peptidase (beta-lactamase class C family)
MIEKISGISYRDYVQENIFKKAGMVHSEFLHLDRVYQDVAEGSDPIRDQDGNISGWKKNLYSFPPIGSPDSGAHLTAGDLDRFLRSVKSGELLSSELTQAFQTPKVEYREEKEWKIMYGYGLSFYFDQAGELVYYQKGGINAGVSGLVRHYPQKGINVILLSNMEDGVWEPGRKINDIIVGGRMGKGF